MNIEIPSWGAIVGISIINGLIVFASAFAGNRADVKNLRGWVKRISQKVDNIEKYLRENKLWDG